MTSRQPRYSKEEFARRGDDMYEHTIRPHLAGEDEGKFVMIDIETGAYEIDIDEMVASDRLLARCPEAQVWMTRVGSRYVRRFGSSHSEELLARSDDQFQQALNRVLKKNAELYRRLGLVD